MVKLEVVIRPFKLEAVEATLESLGIHGFTTSNVVDHDFAARKEVYRGSEYRVGLPKVKVEILVAPDRADEVIEALTRAARTSLDGDDGAILIFEVADAVRIRTGQRLAFAHY